MTQTSQKHCNHESGVKRKEAEIGEKKTEKRNTLIFQERSTK